jgi:gluconolactonase
MEEAQFEIMADGLGFPEGPVVCEDGSVIVVEVRSEQVTRVKPNGDKQLIARIDGAPNGLAIGPDGALYCCNNGGFSWDADNPLPTGSAANYRTGSIDRIDISTGKVERLYDSCGGIPLAGPNDLMFDAQGGFWFTDLGKDVNHAERHGGLYYAKADGSSITRVVHGVAFNGVGLSPDGKTVYAAASYLRWILAFDATNVADQGNGLGSGRIAVEYNGRRFLDSLAMEADGTIAQAVVLDRPGISRANPDTGKETTLTFGSEILPTNIAFGGADMQTAYVTLTTTGVLAKLRWPAPGLKLPYNC